MGVDFYEVYSSFLGNLQNAEENDLNELSTHKKEHYTLDFKDKRIQEE